MRIAIALFEGAEELDFVGPWEVLAAWRFLYPDDVEVILVAEDTVPVTCAKGMRSSPTRVGTSLATSTSSSIPAVAVRALSSATSASARVFVGSGGEER
jgi:putative intracellular protease/amidase